MDYAETRRLIDEIFNRRLDELREFRKCPKCGKETSMVKFFVEDFESKEEPAESIEKWRCLNCLGLFTEELRESE